MKTVGLDHIWSPHLPIPHWNFCPFLPCPPPRIMFSCFNYWIQSMLLLPAWIEDTILYPRQLMSINYPISMGRSLTLTLQLRVGSHASLYSMQEHWLAWSCTDLHKYVYLKGGLILYHLAKIVVLGPMLSKAWVLDQVCSTRHERFHVEWVLYPNRKWLITPITYFATIVPMGLCCISQQSHLGKTIESFSSTAVWGADFRTMKVEQ